MFVCHRKTTLAEFFGRSYKNFWKNCQLCCLKKKKKKKKKKKRGTLKSKYIGMITITILYSRRPQNCTYIVDTLGLVNFTDENHESKQTWSCAFVVWYVLVLIFLGTCLLPLSINKDDCYCNWTTICAILQSIAFVIINLSNIFHNFAKCKLLEKWD